MIRDKPNIYVRSHQELNKLFTEKTMKEFELDTTIEEIYIYKRR
jgi:hypothetical protein